MLLSEIKNEINDYLYNIIINSSINEWVNEVYIKDNLRINTYLNYFEVSIDNGRDIVFLPFTSNIFMNRKEKIKRGILRKMAIKIREYAKNKNEYDKYQRIYKSVIPITKIRENKLNNINNINN